MTRNLFILFIILFFVGCAPVKPVEQEEELPVDFLSDKIAESLEIIAHRAQRLPSGHVDVMLSCMSREEENPIWFDWKVVFYDGQGFPADESEWHTEHLNPKMEKILKAGSIRRDIQNFRFLIRSPLK